MFYRIVEEAISSIEAVKKYYNATLGCIEVSSREMEETNFIGYLIDEYSKLMSLIGRGNADYAKPLAEKIRAALDIYIEFISEDASDGTYKFSFKFKEKKNADRYLFRNNIQDAAIEFRSAGEIRNMQHDNTLVVLMIKFEQFIISIFEALMYKYPDKYIASKQIEYSQIIKIGTEKIKDYIIEKEIESLMRESVSVWIKKLDEHKLDKYISADVWDDFLEAYYRRNIIVHNFAKVNDCYLNALSNTKHSDTKEKVLHANMEYIDHIFVVMQVLVYSIGLGLIKVENSRTESANRYFDFGFRHLIHEDWYISEFIFRVLIGHKDSDSITKAASQINYWISAIQLDGLESVRSEIEECDFSAMHSKFICAKTILLKDYKKSNEMIEELFGKEFTAAAIKAWPLFIDYRKSKEYDEFKSRHLEEFGIFEHDASANGNCIDEADLNAALSAPESRDTIHT